VTASEQELTPCPACDARVLPAPLRKGDAMTPIGTPRLDERCPACDAWLWFDGEQWHAAEPN
jgi:hypothetical protein